MNDVESYLRVLEARADVLTVAWLKRSDLVERQRKDLAEAVVNLEKYRDLAMEARSTFLLKKHGGLTVEELVRIGMTAEGAEKFKAEAAK